MDELFFSKDIIWLISSYVIYEHLKEHNQHICIYGRLLMNNRDISSMGYIISLLASINSRFYNVLKNHMHSRIYFKIGSFSQIISNREFSQKCLICNGEYRQLCLNK
jgi:hypothetical protein